MSRTTGREVCSIPVGARDLSTHDQLLGSRWTGDPRRHRDVEAGVPRITVPHLFSRPIDALPVRFRIDPVRSLVLAREELACCWALEFPALEAQALMHESDCFWSLGMSAAGRSGPKFFDAIVRFRWNDADDRDTYLAPPGVLLGGEPLLLTDHRRPTTSILCQVLDTQLGRGGFAIFDAFDLRRGPVARLWLEAHAHGVPRHTVPQPES